MKIDPKKLELALARNCMNISNLRGKGVHSTVLVKLLDGESDIKTASIGRIAKALNCDPIELIKED